MSTPLKRIEPKSTSKTKILGNDEFLTIAEVCEELHLKPDWLYSRISSESLPFPHVKVGHLIRIPASGLRKWIEAQTREGVAS